MHKRERRNPASGLSIYLVDIRAGSLTNFHRFSQAGLDREQVSELIAKKILLLSFNSVSSTVRHYIYIDKFPTFTRRK